MKARRRSTGSAPGGDSPLVRLVRILCGLLWDTRRMATNPAIDQALLERALELSGKRTRTAAVTLALQEFIARREQRRLIELFDTLDWDPTFDYKSERSRTLPSTLARSSSA